MGALDRGTPNESLNEDTDGVLVAANRITTATMAVIMNDNSVPMPSVRTGVYLNVFVLRSKYMLYRPPSIRLSAIQPIGVPSGVYVWDEMTFHSGPNMILYPF